MLPTQASKEEAANGGASAGVSKTALKKLKKQQQVRGAAGTARLAVAHQASSAVLTRATKAAQGEAAAGDATTAEKQEEAAAGDEEVGQVDAEEAKRRIAAAKAKAKPKQLSAAATALAEAKARANKGKKTADKRAYNQAPKG